MILAQAAVSPQSFPTATARSWWETRWFFLLLIVLAAIPLIYPPIAPLTDLPNHIGRYAVQSDLRSSPELQQWFGFEWMLIGNLGVDLLVQVLAPFVGLEPAVKLTVIGIPMLTVVGFLWTAEEIHGRIPATAALSVPLAYSYAFQFGFVNYCLAMAIAFVGYALALRLTRLGRTHLRTFALLAAGFIAWIAHAYGWAMLGLLWFVTAVVRNWSLGWSKAFRTAAVWCLPLAAPLLPMLFWRSGSSAGIDGWFAIGGKLVWIVTILRDRWMAVDLISAAAIYGFLAIAFLLRSKFRFSPVLLLSGLVLLAVAMILPATIFGSAFADVRLIPYAIAILLLAITVQPTAGESFARAVATLVLGLVIVRIAFTTASLANYSKDFTTELEALKHVPAGSRIAAFSEDACGSPWYDDRLRHLANLAIGRRHAFVNGLFIADGWNSLRVTYDAATPYTGFPSSMASPAAGCDWALPTVQERVNSLPASAFDYVWLLQVPQERRPSTPWLTQVWSAHGSALYRITPTPMVRSANLGVAGR